ncbi:hypothetical protein J5X84_38340 [Streptosporangiaceae bacterium NEAU-GS5]|nr:hypothetical protein [Streptosporangiaceae bacterium NEAU-GS5]
MDQLTRLMDTVYSAPGYHLVEGLAGCGKTAFFVALREALVQAGAEVASFYIRRGHDDSAGAFLPKVISQLIEILQRHDARWFTVGVAETFEGQRLQFGQLWQQASETVVRPLVLLLDALDEQVLQPSISDLLTIEMGQRGRIVVSARQAPEFPATLGFLHPLTTLSNEHRTRLSPHPRARPREEKIRQDFDALLGEGADLSDHVLGMYAAGGGPISDADLGDMLGCTPARIQAARRPISSSLLAIPTEEGRYEFTIAHPDQRAYVAGQLGASRGRELATLVRQWANRYGQDWPDDTPPYLQRHLHDFLVVADLSDRSQLLLSLVSDERRRLSFRSEGHFGTLSQIVNSAARSLDGQPASPRLAVDLFCLLLARIFISSSGVHLSPHVLYAMAWAGAIKQARRIAISISSPQTRWECLMWIASGGIIGGAVIEGCEIAREAGDAPADAVVSENMIRALIAFGNALADASRIEDAAQNLHTVITLLQEQAIQCDHDLAIELITLSRKVRVDQEDAEYIDSLQKDRKDEFLAAIAVRLAASGWLEESLAESGRIGNRGIHAHLIAITARNAVECGQTDRARELAEMTEAMLSPSGTEMVTALTIQELLRTYNALEQNGSSRAWQERLISIANAQDTITGAAILMEVAASLPDGEPLKIAARQAADNALHVMEESGSFLYDSHYSDGSLTAFAGALAQAGDVRNAIKLMTRARIDWFNTTPAIQVARKLAVAGAIDEAIALCLRIGEQGMRVYDFAHIDEHRVSALVNVAIALLEDRSAEKAETVIARAFELTMGVENSSWWTKVAVEISVDLLVAGRTEHALALCDATTELFDLIDDNAEYTRILALTAIVLACAGRIEEAVQFTSTAAFWIGEFSLLMFQMGVPHYEVMVASAIVADDDGFGILDFDYDPAFIARAAADGAFLLARAGRNDDAMRLADKALERAHAWHDSDDSPYIFARLSVVLALCGDTTRARESIRSSSEAAVDSSDIEAEIERIPLTALAAALIGDVESVTRTVDEYVEQVMSSGNTRSLRLLSELLRPLAEHGLERRYLAHHVDRIWIEGVLAARQSFSDEELRTLLECFVWVQNIDRAKDVLARIAVRMEGEWHFLSSLTRTLEDSPAREALALDIAIGLMQSALSGGDPEPHAIVKNCLRLFPELCLGRWHATMKPYGDPPAPRTRWAL